MLLKSMSLTVESTFTDYLISANAEAFGYLFAGFVYLKHGAHNMIYISLIVAAALSASLIGFSGSSVAV